MATFTLCYSGTDCYLDQALVLREFAEMNSYNTYSGYIPSKIHNRLSLQNDSPAVSATLNGCGGPYTKSRKDLPVRVWTVETLDPEASAPVYFSNCSYAPNYLNDSIAGESVEVIAIAGIAKMMGVTFHLVPVGDLDQIKEYWDPKYAMGYSQEDIAYPVDNPRWNQTLQSTAGHFCLRWNQADDTKIKNFLVSFNKVVLLGHSRGGVACIIAANYLAEWFAALKIKIIALDPVPGTGEWWEVLTHLPGVVDMEYIGVYAIDETSAGFNGVVPRVKGLHTGDNTVNIWDPLDPKSDPALVNAWNTSHYQLLYTRGRHATVPGSRSEFGNGESDANDDRVGASGNLVNAYVVQKLIDWGVKLTPPNPADIVTWSNEVLGASHHFADMRDYNYGPKNALGKVNGWFFYNARGISSSAGRNPGSWNYLEAFIAYASNVNTDPTLVYINDNATPNAEDYNQQRGLIDLGVRSKYYKKFGGTGKVHPWTFIADKFAR